MLVANITDISIAVQAREKRCALTYDTERPSLSQLS
jgi:hypothetical protein